MSSKTQLLFLCTGNSCRSQMAEGLGRHFCGDTIEFSSAGIEKHGLNPFAVKAMQEIGIDITSHSSNTLDKLDADNLDYIVTVCGHADETCPVLATKTQRIHKGFDDPPKLAAQEATEEEGMVHYRRVRDEIKAYILTLPSTLNVSLD